MMRTLALLFVALLTGCQGLVEGGQGADSEPSTDDSTTAHSPAKDGGNGTATIPRPPTASGDSDSTDKGSGTTSSRGDSDSDGDTLNDVTATTVDRTSGDTSPDGTHSSVEQTADDSDSGDDVDTGPSDDTDPSSVGADDTEDDGDANASNDDAADTSDSDDGDSDTSDSTNPDAVDNDVDDSDTEVPADAGAPDDTDPPDPLSVAPAIRGSLLTEALTNSDLLPFGDTLSEADSIAHVPLMQSFDRSLGECEACHASDYGAWTAQKYVSLHMFEDIVTQLRFKDGGVLYCDSCHQGAAQFLDRSDPEAVELWMQVNLVDKLERVDGEPHGCETCHGNPPNYELIALWSSD